MPSVSSVCHRKLCSWRFRINDAVRSLSVDSKTTSPVVLVYLRATFDIDQGGLECDEPLAVVRWSSNGSGGINGPQRKRQRGLADPWGEQTAVTRLGNGCNESVFMLALAREALEGEVHCTVEWSTSPPPDRPMAGLRYAIYSQMVTDVPHVPYSTQNCAYPHYNLPTTSTALTPAPARG